MYLLRNLVLISSLIEVRSITVNGNCDVRGASWQYSEIVDWTTHRRRISSNSCPNHFNGCQKEECGGEYLSLAVPQNISFELPLYPEFAQSFTDTTCLQGTLGVTLNGVSLQGMSSGKSFCVAPGSIGYHGGGRTPCPLNGETDGVLYCGNAVVEQGKEFDKCGGHADAFGLYHYNVPPVCLIQQLQVGLVIDQHSPQIGWALDGFPIYGPLGPNGIPMIPCDTVGARAPYCLDVCNGLKAILSEVDSFKYRYYIGGPISSGECSNEIANLGPCSRQNSPCCISSIPPLSARPYTLGCFAGCPVGHKTCLVSGEKGTTGDYLPIAARGPKGLFEGLPSDSNPPSPPPVNTTPTSTPSPTQSTPLPPVLQQAVSQQRSSQYWRNTSVFVRLPEAVGTGLGFFDEFGDLEILPNGVGDKHVLGLTLSDGQSHSHSHDSDTNASPSPSPSASTGHPFNRTLYFSTQTALYAMDSDDSKDTTAVPIPLLEGMFVVTLTGYNFANALSSLRVLLADHPCQGVVITPLEGVQPPLSSLVCSVSSIPSHHQLQSTDVFLSSFAGTCRGPDPNPMEVVRGNTKRPSIVTVDIQKLPCRPYAVALPIPMTMILTATANKDTASVNTVVVASNAKSFLYWSNIDLGAIHRINLLDPKGLCETVVTK
eukprot:gene10121-21090_t